MRRRVDASLWYNLPGILAAYQPIAAPGPLDARYNMRNGGTNAYRAESTALPTWTARQGWAFLRAASTVMETGIILPASGVCTVLIQYNGLEWWWGWLFGEKENAGSTIIGIYNDSNSSLLSYYNTTPSNQRVYSISGGGTSGNIGVVGRYGYFNGVVDSAQLPNTALTPAPLTIGRGYNLGESMTFKLTAAAIYARTLNSTEAFSVAMQMKFCTQPEFSVWARQRDYWFAPIGGFLPAWAQRTNRLIGGGVN